MDDEAGFEGVCVLTWNELVDLKPMGLKLGQARKIEDVKTGCLIEIIFPIFEMSEKVAEILEKKQMTKKPGMKKCLQDLWQRANDNPGKPQRIENLGGGLGVDLLIEGDGTIRYQIYRARVAPSDSEWQTMINYLPGSMQPDDVKRFEHRGKFYIQASLFIVTD